MKSAKEEIREPPEMNMTPMIDIVFQLIIFFMIVIDMSQEDLEDLVLPMSAVAVKDEPEDGRLYVNIRRGGEMLIKRQELSLEGIQSTLQNMVDLPRRDGEPTRDKDGLATRPILIRCDQAAEFKHVQKIMYACGLEGLRIWKVELAAGQVNPEDEE